MQNGGGKSRAKMNAGDHCCCREEGGKGKGDVGVQRGKAGFEVVSLLDRRRNQLISISLLRRRNLNEGKMSLLK